MKEFRKSVGAVAFGVLLALGIAVLVVFGIFWPVAMRFFDPDMARNTFFPLTFLILAAGFSFYWGGMISSYRAPGRRKLHGTVVAPAAFVISPSVNLLSGKGLFPGLDTPAAVFFMLVVFCVSVGGAYVGARRGEAIYHHNQRYIRHRRRQQQGAEKRMANEPERRG